MTHWFITRGAKQQGRHLVITLKFLIVIVPGCTFFVKMVRSIGFLFSILPVNMRQMIDGSFDKVPNYFSAFILKYLFKVLCLHIYKNSLVTKETESWSSETGPLYHTTC